MVGLPLYNVQVLLPYAVHLEPYELHRRMQEWRHDVAMVTGNFESCAFEIPTGDLPLHVRIFAAPVDAYSSALNEALTWSPAWPACREAILECHASVVVAMMARRPLNHAAMLLAFQMVLDTFLLWLDDAAREKSVLYWIPAQQVLPIDRYRSLRMELGPCGPAVNVRIANATGRPGELVADTVGLSPLGLPDLQTVFSDRDPKDVAFQLLLAARRVFVGDRLDCTWFEDEARFPPERDALTLQLD
jgi:hypothetical protein